MITALLALTAPLVFAAPPTKSGPESPAKSVAIRADVVWLGDGRVLEKGVVLFSEGRIAEIGTNVSVPAGVETIEHKGFLTAGLIALHGYTGGQAGEMRDDARPAMPNAKIGLVFDASSPDVADARAVGITSLLLTPNAEGVAPGLTAVVKTSSRRLLKDEAHLSLVFNAGGLVSNREPTSLSGAVAMLDQLFAKPTGAVERAHGGSLPCLFEVGEPADVLRAIDFAKRHDLRGVIHGAVLAGEVADQIKASKLSVIVPAIGVGERRRNLKSVVALAKKEIPFGFGLDSPVNNPADLRLGAVMCVREGVDAKVAWNALTSEAARIAGVADRVGTIDRGMDADVVLWSGDPLDLGSRVIAVYVDGARVDGDKR
ncbi:MAG: amidohydrolase family protein [Planctomycetota bacterium]|nr:amidohydrolase family protein [Planctomycetota bacterium]